MLKAQVKIVGLVPGGEQVGYNHFNGKQILARITKALARTEFRVADFEPNLAASFPEAYLW
jgi:hypothetical protein